MLTAITFILILFTAVLVHEGAHFVNAKSVGVPVRAFSIGFGPVVWRRRWRGTEWRIGILPLGGYVDLPGMAPKVDENGNLQHPDEGMAKKGIGAKLWVLVGGILANFVLGVALVTAAIMLQPGFRSYTSGVDVGRGSEIVSVMNGSPAAQLGIHQGDRIVAINGVNDPTPEQVVKTIHSASQLTITLENGGTRRTVTTPWPPTGSDVARDANGQPLLGVNVTPVYQGASLPQALAESTWFGVRVIPEAVRGFAQGFAAALTGKQTNEVAGPVGIVGLVNQATHVGIASVLFLAALINFSLAVFNVLPIPGLDGGRMLLAGVVALRGRPFKPGQEEQLHFLGIMAVLALMVLITVHEISGLIRG
ncbi:MAG: M50 family metallopeptidase [Deinococcales bacterium]